MNNDGVVIADDASFTSTTSSHVMTQSLVLITMD